MSKIMEEIEPQLTQIRCMPDWIKECKQTNLRTAVMVDTMSRMRQLPFTDHATIGDFLTSLISSTMHISSMIRTIHFLLDSYEEFSMKDSERIRRSNDVEGLDVIGIDLNTPIPVMSDRFWASEKNKINSQLLLRGTPIPPNIDFLFSSMINNGELITAKIGDKEITKLNN